MNFSGFMAQLPGALLVLMVFIMVVVLIVWFLRLPREAQIDKVREWLLWAVTDAERAFGGGTGQIKLRSVYDLFVTRFPWLAKVISFDYFSELVDEALVKMRKILADNVAVQEFVSGRE